MTVSVRPWEAISADLREHVGGWGDLPWEAAVAGDALAAEVDRLEIELAAKRGAIYALQHQPQRDALAAEVRTQAAELSRNIDRLAALQTECQTLAAEVAGVKEQWLLAEQQITELAAQVEQLRDESTRGWTRVTEVNDQLSALTAVVAAVHTALDQYERDRNNGTNLPLSRCVTAIAKAVGR